MHTAIVSLKCSELFGEIDDGMVNLLLVLLQHRHTCPAGTGLHLRLWGCEDLCIAEEGFARLEGAATCRGPDKRDFHTCEASEGSNNLR